MSLAGYLINNFCPTVVIDLFNGYMKDRLFEELPYFGAEEWKKSANIDVEKIEPSRALQEVGNQPSPFFPGYTIKQTHILCCIPKNLSIEELYRIFNKDASKLSDLERKKNSNTYWCWVAKKSALPSYTLFDVQEQVLEKEKQQAPYLLEVLVAIYAARKLQSDLILFPNQDQSTNCRIGFEKSDSEIAILGGDSSKFVCRYAEGWRSPGIAGVIRENKHL